MKKGQPKAKPSQAPCRTVLPRISSEKAATAARESGHTSYGGKAAASDGEIVTILANAGDVLAMRPLVSHCSNKSVPGTRRQRRVLHLEFAADATLPDGYAWHEFIPGTA